MNGNINFRRITAVVFLTFATHGLMAQSPSEKVSAFTKTADAFLKKHVVDGLVTYNLVHADRSQLDGLVKQIANMPALEENELKSFWINSYNILAIKSIVDAYPTKGPMSIPGFFDRALHRVSGKEMTLNQLEKEQLYKKFPDARLHFALVCAAKGCPPLMSKAFTPDSLEWELDARTRLAVADGGLIRKKGAAYQLSEIFKWYAKDFAAHTWSVEAFINKYRKGQKLKLDQPVYFTYDWNLNQRIGSPPKKKK